MSEVEGFEALLARGQDSALLRYTLGSLYLKKGKAGDAVLHLREAVAQDPGYSAAWKVLGRALTECGDLQAAMDAYRTGIQVAESRGDKQAAREMQVFLKRLAKTAKD